MYGTGKAGIRLARLCLTTILCTGLAAPAFAETARQYRNLDANGVDLTHGDQMIGVSEGSIGTDDGELALIRRAIGAGDGSIVIGDGSHQWDRIYLQRSPGPGAGVITTSIIKEGKFENFTSNGTLPSGSTLSGNAGSYLYRMADGTAIAFDDPSGQDMGISTFCNSEPGQTYCILLPSSISTPDGKSVSIAWDLWRSCLPPVGLDDPLNCATTPRIAEVSNNSGYRIAFTYASNGDGAGAGGSPPPNSWKQRTGASFYNDTLGGGALASTSYSYPATGIVDVTDTAGRSWRFTGDHQKITAIRRPGASTDTTSYGFSTGAQVSSVTRDGVTSSYSRSVSGSTATMTVTNALSQATTIVSDLTIGRPTSVTNALSQTTAYQYDTDARLTQITYPEGNKTVFAYDARGNVTSTTLKAKAGSGLADIATTASYPSSCFNPLTCNSPEWTRDAKGNQTDYTYDENHGGVLTVTLPADSSSVRPQARYSYTTSGTVTLLSGISQCMSGASCGGSAAETKTTIGYNSNLLPVSAATSAGDNSVSATTAMTYDAVGNLKTVDGPLAGTDDTTTYRYDAGRRVTGVVGPDPDGGGVRKPIAQKMTYGNDGLTLKEVGIVDDAGDTAWASFSSQEQVAISYDANARPVKSELKSGGTTYAVSQTSYDAIGRVDCSVQRTNPATFGSLPGACSLGTTGSHGPDRIARTSYDAAGRPTKVQTAYGATEQADEVTTSYTSNGQVAHVIDAENNRTDYTYDGHDRLAKTEYPSATKGANAVNAGDYEQLTHDANGNVTTRRLRDGTSINYGYDNLNRVTSVDLPNTVFEVLDKGFEYDLLGRLTAATMTNWWNMGFAYDALGRQVLESAPSGSVTRSFDAAGRMTSETLPGGGLTVGYDYDVVGNVTAIRENGATSGVGVLASYSYDNLGRRSGVTYGNGVSHTYAYDPVSRLSSLGASFPVATANNFSNSFTYNAASQIASTTRGNDSYAWTGHYNVDRSYSVNGLNQMTATGAAALGYDARGNLTTSGSNSYSYGPENLLATSTVGGVNRLMSYDAIGRLTVLMEDASNTIRFNYSGSRLVAERDWHHNLLRRYVHGPGIDEPIVWYEGTGTSDRRFLTSDERGSIINVTDGTGATLARNSYDEYGIPASGNLGRFGYTGQTWLPEVGLWYYKSLIRN
jgi:YD repeat-containing protein